MRATPRGKRKRLAIDVLRKTMHDFDALATAARKANDPSYTRWAKAAAEIAQQVAQYESPRLAATMTVPAEASKQIDFVFRIFDRPRRLIEAVATEAPSPNSPAPAHPDAEADDPKHHGAVTIETDVDGRVAQGPAPPDAPKRDAQYPAPPSSPPPVEDKLAPLMDCNARKSLWEHPSFAPPRFGSRH